MLSSKKKLAKKKNQRKKKRKIIKIENLVNLETHKKDPEDTGNKKEEDPNLILLEKVLLPRIFGNLETSKEDPEFQRVQKKKKRRSKIDFA